MFKDTGLKRNLIIASAVVVGLLTTLSAAPMGTAPQINTEKKSEILHDGKNIVLGTYKSMQQADNALSGLLDYVDSNSKVVNLELAHGFDYAVKEESGAFKVSIEPFVNDSVLDEVLAAVKSRYPKAHAETCVNCVSDEVYNANANYKTQKEKEVLANAVAEHKETPIVVVSQEEESEKETSSVTPTQSIGGFELPFTLPFDPKFLLYGLGGFALLLLVFLVMRKPKKASDKELRAMYAQAKELEKELADDKKPQEETLEIDEADLEQAPPTQPEPVTPVPPKAAPAARPQPKAQVAPTPRPQATPQARPEPKPAARPQPTARPEPTPVPAARPQATPSAAPTTTSSTPHKLRERNKDVGSITKENFKEFEGMRLLIAEDNLINQKVIVGLLKDSGINIKIANDGQECMEILAEDSNYPIILMDAHMPRIDGLEATRLIRANPDYSHITVMALSGDTGADDVRKMREAGMEEQLEKPLKIAALYQALYCYFDPSAIGGEDDELPEIRLDNSLGLEMLGGDVELYHEILREFEALYNDSDNKIELWIKHGDYDKAKAILLDVKGIGESIGTAELTDTAEAFREAIINGETASFGKLMNQYRSQLKSILADIAEV